MPDLCLPLSVFMLFVALGVCVTTKEARPDTTTLHLAVASLQRAMWPNSCVTWSGILVKSHLRQYGLFARRHMFTSWQLQQEMCMSACMIVACSAQVNHCKPVHGLLAGHTTYTKDCDLCLISVSSIMSSHWLRDRG